MHPEDSSHNAVHTSRLGTTPGEVISVLSSGLHPVSGGPTVVVATAVVVVGGAAVVAGGAAVIGSGKHIMAGLSRLSTVNLLT